MYPSDLGYRRASNSALFSPPGGAGSCWTSAGLVHRRSGGVGPRRGLPGPPAGPRGRYDTKLPPLGEPSRDPRGPSRDKSGDVSLEPSNPRTDQDDVWSSWRRRGSVDDVEERREGGLARESHAARVARASGARERIVRIHGRRQAPAEVLVERFGFGEHAPHDRDARDLRRRRRRGREGRARARVDRSKRAEGRRWSTRARKDLPARGRDVPMVQRLVEGVGAVEHVRQGRDARDLRRRRRRQRRGRDGRARERRSIEESRGPPPVEPREEKDPLPRGAATTHAFSGLLKALAL